MNNKPTPTCPGQPSLTIAGFQLWVHGRQFVDATDSYDGNWLRVTAHCGESGASEWGQGAMLMVTDIARFRDRCSAPQRAAGLAFHTSRLRRGRVALPPGQR